jgi:Zn-dependent protease with chaperone function
MKETHNEAITFLTHFLYRAPQLHDILYSNGVRKEIYFNSVKSDVINAAAGVINIYLNSALLNLEPNLLLAVTLHELGHISKKHNEGFNSFKRMLLSVFGKECEFNHKIEHEADLFAAEICGVGTYIKLLEILGGDDSYSHPSAEKRIAHIKKHLA